MIKLASSTLGCPDWSFDEVMDRYREYGIRGVEIRGIDGEMEALKMERFFPENVEKTVAAMKAHGLCFVGFGTSVCLHAMENREELVKYISDTAEVCSLAGIPAIRVFGDELPEADGAARELAIARIIGNLSAVCEAAAQKGVMINLEIHGTVNSIRNLTPILEGVRHIRNFGILWDVEHSDKTTGDDFQTFYELIRPYLRHVHFKDYRRVTDAGHWVLCEIGEGDIPLAEIVKTLQKDGYDGYISLEWEKKWHPELSDPELSFPRFVSFMKTIGAADDN